MVVELVQIIEDEPDHAGLLAYAFRKAHYKTSIAYDGWAGLEAVRRLKPALVVLDVMLPELDGYGVCRLLRKDPETQRIPILLISALDDKIHRSLAQILGADDLVTKPFSLQEVVQRATHLIRAGCAKEPATDVRAHGSF